MKINDEVIVMTGGMHTENYVTEYRLTDGGETPFAPLGQGRDMHACGVYIDKDVQQVCWKWVYVLTMTALFLSFTSYVFPTS